MTVHLTRFNPHKNVARFYTLTVEETLFGGAALLRTWGRMGSRGREIRQLFAQQDEAQRELTRWLRRKSARGYVTTPANEGAGF